MNPGTAMQQQQANRPGAECAEHTQPRRAAEERLVEIAIRSP